MKFYWIYEKIIRKLFPFWQKLGLNITLNHFYSPIPDLRELNNDLWETHNNLDGININEANQLELLSLFKKKYQAEYDQFPKQRKETSNPYTYYINNQSFGPVSGEVLYCMIRNFKPMRIIEIGSGNSTYCSAQAILKNKEENNNLNCKLTSIDPYPNKILRSGFPGFSKLIANKIQDVPIEEFDKLEENDILFIDSSHVLKIGSDVQFEYLKVLPRLKKGVIIHIHDILLPAEYHKEWILNENKFWNEQYLLQAFLAFNNAFEVLFAGAFLHFYHSDKLKLAFRTYSKKRFSTSFWIKKII